MTIRILDLVILALFILVIGLIWLLLRDRTTCSRLRQAGHKGIADIAMLWQYGSAFYVTYSYSVQGRRYERVQGISKADYLALTDVSQVPVTYLPENPSSSRLLDYLSGDLWRTQIFLILLFIAVILLGLLNRQSS